MKKKANAKRMSGQQGPRRDRKSRRNVLVLASLLGSLTFTSILLLTLAPAPLTPDAARSLFVLDEQDSLDEVFKMRAPVVRDRWKLIYIHHSRAQHGNAVTLDERGMGDHFLIGNGNGCGDGEIQIGQRWDLQRPASPAAANVADNCISICLVGDFDSAPPTDRQLRRLEQLVQALQRQFGIPARAVLAYDRPGSAAGIGRHFPARSFSERLLP